MVTQQERAPEGTEEAQRACVPPVMLELGSRMGQMTVYKVDTVRMTLNFDNDNAPSPNNTPRLNEQPMNGILASGVIWCLQEASSQW